MNKEYQWIGASNLYAPPISWVMPLIDEDEDAS